MERLQTLTEDGLAELIRRFYARARQDEVLGPVFDSAIQDWPPHLDQIAAFWSATMLGSARYRGNALAAHAKHSLEPGMFDRWLALWAQTAGELFAPDIALALERRAERIADSLKLGLFFRPEATSGVGPGP